MYLEFAIRRRGSTDPPVRLTVAGPVVTIGRDAECTICLADIPSVSTRHAEIACRGGRWTVSDTRSRNHTFLNGIRVDGPAPIGPRDEISLGANGPSLVLVGIHFDPPVKPARPSEPPAARGPEAAREPVPSEPPVEPARSVASEPDAEPAAAAEDRSAPLPARALLVGRNRPGPAESAAPLVGAAAAAAEAGHSTVTGGEAPSRRRWPVFACLVAGGLALAAAGSYVWVQTGGVAGRVAEGFRDTVASLAILRRGEVFPEVSFPGTGCGFLVDGAGRMATCAHLVDLADEVTVSFGSGGPEIRALGWVAASRPHDLVIMQLDVAAAALPAAAPLGPPAAGAAVAIGSPDGQQLAWQAGSIESVGPFARFREAARILAGPEEAPDGRSAETLVAELTALRTIYDQLEPAGREAFFEESVTLGNGVVLTRRDQIEYLELLLAEARRPPRPVPGPVADDTEVVIQARDAVAGGVGGPVVSLGGSVVGMTVALASREGRDGVVAVAIASRHITASLPAAAATPRPFRELP